MPLAPSIHARARLSLVLVFTAACAASAPAAPSSPAAVVPPSAPSPGDLDAQFLGRWTGQLAYRDFQSDEQVMLPTWLTMSRGPDRQSIQLDYVYDDGPHKTVRERMIIAIDRAAAQAQFISDRDHTREVYAVAGLADFAKLGRGTLVLTGPGKENEHAVDVRLTLTLKRNLYTLRKETRLPGQDFLWRDAYTFTRAEPPAP